MLCRFFSFFVCVSFFLWGLGGGIKDPVTSVSSADVPDDPSMQAKLTALLSLWSVAVKPISLLVVLD